MSAASPSPLAVYLVAFFAFLIGALVGLFMAVWHFMGWRSGKAVGIMHGVWTVSGLVLLGVGLATVQAGPAWWIFAAFVVTAAGGLYLFTRQVKDEPWPGAVIIAHGSFAILSIVALGLWLANRPPPASDGGDVPAATPDHQAIPVEDLTD